MDWAGCLNKTIDYIENHLLEEINYHELGKEIAISPFYLQKGFKIMTGITIAKYVRNRRLYLAALELIMDNHKIIDVAFKYGYDSAESFTRAFSRFHGISPTGIKKNPSKIKSYLPLNISISILGGNTLDFVIEKMDSFKVVGIRRRFDYENAYEQIPLFWEEFCNTYMMGKGSKDNQQIVNRCMIGEFGVCISRPEDERGFDYIIAGKYDELEAPPNMVIYEIPELVWAKFRCVGPLAGNFQSLNTRIFSEWLPGNSDYEIAADISLEWYSCGDTTANDYESGIWIPVKSKSSINKHI